jgi:hypothetical protein
MSRILLPLAIAGAVFAQVPVVGWENLSSQAAMAAVLIWFVTKTMPAKDAQALALATTFAETIKVGQDKTAFLADKFTALTAAQTLAIAAQNDKMLQVGKDLATAIGETREALAGLQLAVSHCPKQASNP